MKVLGIHFWRYLRKGNHSVPGKTKRFALIELLADITIIAMLDSGPGHWQHKQL